MKKINVILVLLVALTFSSCTMRLVDFTTISSKNVGLDIDRSKGIKVEAKKTYFLGIGWNIKDALDKALEDAGPEYDLLIDGVVRYSSYPFIAQVSVEGTAVSSRDMRTSMTEAEYKKWLASSNIFDPETAIINSGQ